mmetsp:Transcript_34378/g.75197  ORF Transcript_34378/g.75197 Transcript_34378/m.75197 type:complete len:268 (+) Transcript_34378:949-1752(+)
MGCSVEHLARGPVLLAAAVVGLLCASGAVGAGALCAPLPGEGKSARDPALGARVPPTPVREVGVVLPGPKEPPVRPLVLPGPPLRRPPLGHLPVLVPAVARQAPLPDHGAGQPGQHAAVLPGGSTMARVGHVGGVAAQGVVEMQVEGHVVVAAVYVAAADPSVADFGGAVLTVDGEDDGDAAGWHAICSDGGDGPGVVADKSSGWDLLRRLIAHLQPRDVVVPAVPLGHLREHLQTVLEPPIPPGPLRVGPAARVVPGLATRVAVEV